MVDVTHAVISNGGSGSTEPLIRDSPGQWLIMVAFDRSGGESSLFTSTHPAMDAAMSEVVGLATRPTESDRRGVWVWAGIVPEGLEGTFIIDMDVFDGSETSVDCSWIAILTDMDASWSVEGIASDDSASTAVGSQPTGTTPSVPAGEAFGISAISIRGSTTVAWANSDNTPPNPGGGDWDLNVDTIGGSANSRRGSVGAGDLGAQPSQTYDDVATLGTDRLATAAIAVWIQGSGGPALSPAVETNQAQPLAAAKSGEVAPSVSSSAAVSLVGLKTGGLSVAAESSESRPLSGAKVAALGRIEVDSAARPLPGLKRAALGVGEAGSEALPLGSAKARPLSPILTASIALPMVVGQLEQLGTIIDNSTAQALGASKLSQLTRIIEIDSLVSLIPSGGHGPPYKDRHTLVSVSDEKTLIALED